MLKYEFYRLLYNGANANVVRRDLDLYFQGYNISGNHIFNILKTVTAIEKILPMTFMQVDIRYHTA